MISVTVYSTGPGCMQCRLTCARLESVGIPFTVHDITEPGNDELRDYLTSDLGYSQAPIVIVDDEPEHHWSGFQPDKIDDLATTTQSVEDGPSWWSAPTPWSRTGVVL